MGATVTIATVIVILVVFVVAAVHFGLTFGIIVHDFKTFFTGGT
jgi:hypothetical protein